MAALSHLRICDFTGQLAGAGATRFLAALGAQVIRIEDPVTLGRWDILRGIPPATNLSPSFNNHNVEKLGVTLNLRTEKGKGLLRRLIAISDVVTENFSAGVLARLGFDYESMRQIRPDIIYVSNCGFGHTGPYSSFKTWGPSVQAFSGLTFQSALKGQPPAGWGYSYMDHTGAYFMAMAILAAVHHRNASGEAQWVDCATTEAAATLNGPVMLDYTVNGRPLRRPGFPDSNRSQLPPMAPHGIYPAVEPDTWVAIACRNDDEWQRAATAAIAEPWARDVRWRTLSARLEGQDELDALLSAWTRQRDPFATAAILQAVRVPASAVQSPEQRIDFDPNTEGWGLWPTVMHSEAGYVRVDGLPVHFSETDWKIARGAPCLGEHNDLVFGEMLGIPPGELASLKAEGVI